MISKIALFFFALLVSFPMISQTDGINYKALIKDGAGNVVTNDLIVVQFQILQGGGMTNVYQETHTPTTDANGIVILNIGTGSTGGVFADIDWGRDSHYLNVQINTGSGLINMGTTQFMAVPYALKSENSSMAAIANSLLLKSETVNQFNINYGSIGDKLQVSEVDIAGNVLEISNGELTLPQYAGTSEEAVYVDINGKLMRKVKVNQTFNTYNFFEPVQFSGAVRYRLGVQLPDGVTIAGLSAYVLDNEPGTNTGIQNTPFLSLERESKTDKSVLSEEIFRVEGQNTATNVFTPITTTNDIGIGRDIIDNANYIYYLEIFMCSNCDFREITILE
jgi:hypothetical protein